MGYEHTEGEHEVIELTDDDRKKYGDETLRKALFESPTYEF